MEQISLSISIGNSNLFSFTKYLQDALASYSSSIQSDSYNSPARIISTDLQINSTLIFSLNFSCAKWNIWDNGGFICVYDPGGDLFPMPSTCLWKYSTQVLGQNKTTGIGENKAMLLEGKLKYFEFYENADNTVISMDICKLNLTSGSWSLWQEDLVVASIVRATAFELSCTLQKMRIVGSIKYAVDEAPELQTFLEKEFSKNIQVSHAILLVRVGMVTIIKLELYALDSFLSFLDLLSLSLHNNSIKSFNHEQFNLEDKVDFVGEDIHTNQRVEPNIKSSSPLEVKIIEPNFDEQRQMQEETVG
ncbi:uncharacterized protein G2W53_017579 [Senna tora]|uniref:Uncharacterized protein n=1 Tax=Senna tora TaxID=362788 RepID=A0A834WKB4_9FABA|nr:uncharacterized protein G2W53_017579 [Senna tora]